jgi:hypothetical protein
MGMGTTFWQRKSMSRSSGSQEDLVDDKVKEGREVPLPLSLVDLAPGMGVVCLAGAGTREMVTERLAVKIDVTALATPSNLGTIPLVVAAAEAFRIASHIIALATTTIIIVTVVKTAGRMDMGSSVAQACCPPTDSELVATRTAARTAETQTATQTTMAIVSRT